MTEKRYKSIGTNLECSNGTEYMLIKRNDGVNVCQVCNEYTAKEIVDELNSLADENEQLKQNIGIILKYCREKGKYAMDMKETKAHNVLQRILNDGMMGMTEKRFTYEYDEYNGNLFDNKMNTFYHIEDSDENIEVLCDRLNWLVEENEHLKKSVKRQQDSNNECAKLIEEQQKENEQLKKENDYLLEVMFAIKEYAENEDYENIIKAINKVSERLG